MKKFIKLFVAMICIAMFLVPNIAKDTKASEETFNDSTPVVYTCIGFLECN